MFLSAGRARRLLALLALAGLSLAACRAAESAPALQTPEGGDAGRGRTLLSAYGCDACHTIPGVLGADTHVGPPLTAFARRQFIAGRLANTADNLILWIQDPQGVDPETAMPNLGVSEQEARDMAAYLATLTDD